MPSSTVTFAHSIGDAVAFVEARDIRARVQAVKIEFHGELYRVAWWQDGRRMEDWVYGWEIAAA